MNAVTGPTPRTSTGHGPRPSRPEAPARSFQDVLAPLLKDVPVRPGDSLSRICAEQLRQQGCPLSPQAIHHAVQTVARANHLPDPDRIYPGQVLDLSALAALTAGRPAPWEAAPPGTPQPWRSLVDGAMALSSGFGVRKDPFTLQLKNHAGIDVAAPAGAPILAFAPGSVTFSGWKHDYGNTVVVRHDDGSESLYSHLSHALVKVGDRVEGHAPIAQVGTSGRSTGAHLHFEIHNKGRALNPIHQLALQVLQAEKATGKA